MLATCAVTNTNGKQRVRVRIRSKGWAQPDSRAMIVACGASSEEHTAVWQLKSKGNCGVLAGGHERRFGFSGVPHCGGVLSTAPSSSSHYPEWQGMSCHEIIFSLAAVLRSMAALFCLHRRLQFNRTQPQSSPSLNQAPASPERRTLLMHPVRSI